MLFMNSKKENSSDTAPKRQSTLGFLFSPSIGNDIRPLAESINVFVDLIALIFAANGLFPKNHPALMHVPGASLTLKEIISTSYNGLKFTREGIPQVALFFAVVGCLVFSALAVITGILLLLVGTAHAQGPVTPAATCSSGIFSPCSGTEDLSIQWLDYLFASKAITTSNHAGIAVSPVLQSVGFQTILRSALGFYSTAVLVLAGVILLYHLLSMVAETAHTGKPMGRANQIWAPIRLVVAIGLLVPISIGGLNVGQAITIKIAKWGSGLASHAWTFFLDGFANNPTSLVAKPSSAVPSKLLTDLILIKACVRTYNYEMKKVSDSPDYQASMSGVRTVENGTITYSFGSKKDPGICGKFSYRQTGGTVPVAGGDAIIGAPARLILSAVSTAAAPYISQVDLISARINYYNGSFSCPENDLEKCRIKPEHYMPIANELNTKIREAIANAATTSDMKDALAKIVETWKKDGWVSAGSLFNSISTLQGGIANAALDGLPQTTPPDVELLSHKDYSGVSSTLGNVAKMPLQGFSKGLSNYTFGQVDLMGLNGPSSRYAYTATAEKLAAFARDLAGGSIGSYKGEESVAGISSSNDDSSTGTILIKVLKGFEKIGSWAEIWPTDSTNNFVFPLITANPFAELSMLGVKFLNGGLTMILYGSLGSVAGAAVGAVTGIIVGAPAAGVGAAVGGIALGSLGAALGQLGGLVCTVGGLIASAGVTLTFLLPLVPFFHFFFAVLTWAFIVFEAVISMPLFALAHLTPHGDGLPGGMAQRGYFFLLSILLRPILTIFGLIAGVLLFYVAIAFLNETFLFATRGNLAVSGFSTIAKLIYSIMYVVLAYICANTCFKAISHFPNHSLNWMNASGPGMKELGDKGTLMGTMGAVGGYVAGKQLGSIAQGATSALGKGLDTGVSGINAKRKEWHTDKIKVQQGDFAKDMISSSPEAQNSLADLRDQNLRGDISDAQYKEAVSGIMFAEASRPENRTAIKDQGLDFDGVVMSGIKQQLGATADARSTHGNQQQIPSGSTVQPPQTPPPIPPSTPPSSGGGTTGANNPPPSSGSGVNPGNSIATGGQHPSWKPSGFDDEGNGGGI